MAVTTRPRRCRRSGSPACGASARTPCCSPRTTSSAPRSSRARPRRSRHWHRSAARRVREVAGPRLRRRAGGASSTGSRPVIPRTPRTTQYRRAARRSALGFAARPSYRDRARVRAMGRGGPARSDPPPGRARSYCAGLLDDAADDLRPRGRAAAQGDEAIDLRAAARRGAAAPRPARRGDPRRRRSCSRTSACACRCRCARRARSSRRNGCR